MSDMTTWPAVRRVQVGLILRELRERSGVKAKEIAGKLDWYSSKLTRVEKGELTVSAAEVDALLTMFGVPEGQEAERLRALAKEARRRDQPAKVPDWAGLSVALEGAAVEIKFYDPEVIPAVLQTENYAKAVLSNPLDETLDVSPSVEERMRRAQRLQSDTGPMLWCVIGEAALYREIGGKSVLREQLQYLRWAAKRPNITIQVLPYSAGEHAALGTSWTMLHLDEPAATFVYLEGLTSADYLDKPTHITKYVKAFDNLRVISASDRVTVGLLESRIKDLS